MQSKLKVRLTDFLQLRSFDLLNITMYTNTSDLRAHNHYHHICVLNYKSQT